MLPNEWIAGAILVAVLFMVGVYPVAVHST